MSEYGNNSFGRGEKSPDDILPPVDLELLATNLRSDSLNWGATPLNTYHDPELYRQQEEIRNKLEERSREVPSDVGYIPQYIRKYVTDNFLTRFNGRTMANFDNFSQRLRDDLAECDEIDRDILEKAMWGRATPAELLYVRCAFGMASIELGCLTHPYGVLTDQDKLDEMRGSVKDAILMLGGDLAVKDEKVLGGIDGDEEGLDGRDVFSVKRADNTLYGEPMDHVQRLIVLTRKRNLGRLPDGSIVRERSSFILRIGEDAEFNQEAAQRMREVKLTYNDDAMRMLAEAGNIAEELPPMIAGRKFGTIIPLSTTVYAFNRLTDTRIKTRDEQRKEEELRRRAVLFAASETEKNLNEPAATTRLLGGRALSAVTGRLRGWLQRVAR